MPVMSGLLRCNRLIHRKTTATRICESEIHLEREMSRDCHHRNYTDSRRYPVCRIRRRPCLGAASCAPALDGTGRYAASAAAPVLVARPTLKTGGECDPHQFGHA